MFAHEVSPEHSRKRALIHRFAKVHHQAALIGCESLLPPYHSQNRGSKQDRRVPRARLAAQLVAQQGREIGIRMALGADRGRLRRSVVFSGLRIAAAGVVAGVVLTAVAARLVARVVPGVDPPAVWAVAIESLLLLAVAGLAAWVPARRASAIDPLSALRSE